MPYLISILSVLFVFGGGFFLIASQISEFAISQRRLSTWVYDTPIAHRGLYNNSTIPENSLSSFKAAIAKGYAIELDVHLTQDGEAIVFHDDDLERATGHIGKIVQTTYSQSQEYRLWNTSEMIPTLKQTLDLVHGQVPLYIEIKNTGEVGALEKTVHKLLSSYNGPVTIVSFNAKTLEWFRINAPEHFRAQNLSLDDWHFRSLYSICQQTLKKCKLSKPHMIIYNATKLPPLLVGILSWFKPFIAYNVTSPHVCESIQHIVSNIIFEHFEPQASALPKAS